MIDVSRVFPVLPSRSFMAATLQAWAGADEPASPSDVEAACPAMSEAMQYLMTSGSRARSEPAVFLMHRVRTHLP